MQGTAHRLWTLCLSNVCTAGDFCKPQLSLSLYMEDHKWVLDNPGSSRISSLGRLKELLLIIRPQKQTKINPTRIALGVTYRARVKG